MPVPAERPYDGDAAFPDVDGPDALPLGGPLQLVVTSALVLLPIAGLITAIVLAWGHGVDLTDLVLMAAMYVVTGLGVTVGYHRLFTHRSFRAAPALRVALAVAGSMSFEGNPISWVAIHRRHHAFSDRPGDPHSPFRYGTSVAGMTRGLLHAHLGWMFRTGIQQAPAERYAPDLLADRRIRLVSAAFPLISAASLAIPFGLGWAVGGGLRDALLGLLWGGLVRIALLQHVTWSVNSLCHVLGSRAYTMRRFDRAANFWPLAIPSFGEAWHNYHHSDPTSARHGVGRGEIDISAGLIAVFERLGWASDVRWPTPERIAGRVRPADEADETAVAPEPAAAGAGS